MVGRNDYAANAGDRPPSLSATDTWKNATYEWLSDVTNPATVKVDVTAAFGGGSATSAPPHFQVLFDVGVKKGSNGVVGPCSELQLRQVEDGASNTIWVGEKHIGASQYDAVAGDYNQGNDQGWDASYDYDNVRWTQTSPKPDEWIHENNPSHRWNFQVFGSSHPSGCQFVYLDGSTHTISYDVDPAVFHLLGSRSDGELAAAIP